MMPEAGMASPFRPGFKPTKKLALPQVTSNKLLDKLEALCDRPQNGDLLGKLYDLQHDPLCKDLDVVLTPAQIQEFFYISTSLEEHPNYSSATSIFTAKLIQNAHDQGGINHFTFNLSSLKPLDYFGFCLRKGKTNLDMTIFGQLGHWAFNNSFCDAHIESAKSVLGSGSLGTIGCWKYIQPLAGRYSQSISVSRVQIATTNTEQYSSYLVDNNSTMWMYSTDIQPEMVSRYNLPRFGLLTPHREKHDFFQTKQANCYFVNSFVWNKLWQPAVETFTAMEHIFGGRE